MAKYYYTSEDRKTHYDGIIDGKISKPFIGVIYHFWDEIYKGKKNKKGEREGQGTMEWNFDTKGNWRFEDWANNEFWHYSKNPKREYDYEDKLNPEFEGRFKIMMVPNITNICYGRGVGYKIEEIVLSEEIQKISATKIRAKMREDGKI